MTTLQLLILGAAAVVFILALLGLLLLRRRRKGKPQEPVAPDPMDERVAERLGIEVEAPLVQPQAPAPIPASRTVVPHSKILAMVGARQLLEDVKTYVLKGKGSITIRGGSAQLIWSYAEDPSVQRSIMIIVQDAETVLINGQPFPATPEGVKDGLVECLKMLRRH